MIHWSWRPWGWQRVRGMQLAEAPPKPPRAIAHMATSRVGRAAVATCSVIFTKATCWRVAMRVVAMWRRRRRGVGMRGVGMRGVGMRMMGMRLVGVRLVGVAQRVAVATVCYALLQRSVQ